MPEPITGKINITKIDKTALFKGQAGEYLDFALWPSKNSQYGDDYYITQSISKERRAKGERGPIIGNAKILKRDGAPSAAASNTTHSTSEPAPAKLKIDDDDIPPF